MPSATGQNWEKYKKEFADDEEPEKKITPLTDEYGLFLTRNVKAESDFRLIGTYKCSRHMALHPMLLRLRD